MPSDGKTTEHQARALFARSRAALLLADDDRRYVDCNPAACELLGLARDEILARRIDDLAPAELRPLVESRWNEFLATGIQAGEWELVTASGERVAVEYSATANVMPGRHLSILLPTVRDDGRAPAAEGARNEHPLTAREREVLSLVARGMTSEQIAEQLAVSPETVRTHVRNALDGLGARTRAHAIAIALRERLIEA